MSLDDLAARLERSFRASEQLLTRLVAGLVERRTAWISARPARVQPTADLDALAAELQAADRARAAIVGELATVLPLPIGLRAADLHVDVTRIAAAIPAVAAQRLRAAAADVTALARRVRREIALGSRLLAFAQRANDGLLADLAVGRQAGNHRSYDRAAHAHRGMGRYVAAGSLIDGRM
jgi:hypothetical protein